MVLADFEAYVECQRRASLSYIDPEGWTRKCILNVAQMGIFSSDRTVEEYAQDIWGVRPVTVKPTQPRAADAPSGSALINQ
jgi:starch phosphorylase